MAFDKEKIFELPADERRVLAFELLDSIDEEFINKPLPEWKKQLVDQRIQKDKENPNNVLPWSEVRKKYDR